MMKNLLLVALLIIAFTNEIQAINREPDNFKSAPPYRMNKIIDKYAPIVRAIYDEDDPNKYKQNINDHYI